MKKLTIAMTCLTVFALMLSAADINGKWTGSVTGPDGQLRENTMTFKTHGDELTGTIVSSVLGEAPIMDGKISGDDISFSVNRNIGGSEVKILYKGRVSGDQIKFTIEAGGQTVEMTVKKVTT